MDRTVTTTREGRDSIVAAVERTGIVAIIRMKEPDKVRAVVDAIAEGGIRTLEVTMTVPGAVELIRQLAPSLPAGFVLGAGTVLDAETVARVVDAGARFVVSPVFRPAVIAACHARDVAGDAGLLHADGDPRGVGRRAPTSSRSFRRRRWARRTSRTCAPRCRRSS